MSTSQHRNALPTLQENTSGKEPEMPYPTTTPPKGDPQLHCHSKSTSAKLETHGNRQTESHPVDAGLSGRRTMILTMKIMKANMFMVSLQVSSPSPSSSVIIMSSAAASSYFIINSIVATNMSRGDGCGDDVE